MLRAISLSCSACDGLQLLIANNYQRLMAIVCVVGYTVQHYALIGLLYQLIDRRRAENAKKLKHPMALAAGIIFACWLPWLFINYPGSLCPDSLGQVLQWRGDIPMTAHHPPFSTLIMGLCYSLGSAVWDANFGCFLYCLLQAVCGALIFGYGLSVMDAFGAPRKMYIAGIIFFGLVPMWGVSVQWFEKDLLYAEIFTLDILFLAQVIKAGRCTVKDAVRIGVTTLAAVLLRKTGIYELFPALIIAALWLKKASRKRMLCAALGAYVLCMGVNNVLYPALGIEKGSVREALNIPFQQTAKYCLTYPDEVTEEEYEVINSVLDYSAFKNYKSYVSDPIKNTYKGDSTKLPAYFKTWFSMFLKHPVSYIDTAFANCCQVFAPGESVLDAVLWSGNTGYDMLAVDVYKVGGDKLSGVFDCWREISTHFPITDMFVTSGVYTWALAICIVQLLRRKRYPALILTVPGIVNVLICAASPLNGSSRYALPLIASIHALLCWVHIFSNGGEEGEKVNDT